MVKLRLTTYDNRAGLELGERVCCYGEVTFGYAPGDVRRRNRVMMRGDHKFQGVVVGVVKKAVGIRDPQFYDEYGPEPATFTAKKYYWVYEVKTSLRGQIRYVLPQDIRVLTEMTGGASCLNGG